MKKIDMTLMDLWFIEYALMIAKDQILHDPKLFRPDCPDSPAKRLFLLQYDYLQERISNELETLQN